MVSLQIADLAAVVYSAGRVFDGLGTGRLDTQNFLRSGDLHGVTSRADLELLRDMRDVSAYVINHTGESLDGQFVKAVNAQLTRSASIFPGQFKRDDQGIGVRTRYGQHLPPAVGDAALEAIVCSAIGQKDVHEMALELFIQLAKAQPFMDGNKRTAIFTANACLIGADDSQLLTIPVDEDDASVADRFNDLLARAYIFDEDEAVKDLLRARGFIPSPAQA
ncbi:Fic family protein [Brevibacterium moorei]|uniref:Fic family protein n=1 Tax=Brevibacterium moorei TaxID=2968457 RepID=UPI00211BAB20|nr:Fic family protein [Brevibacterium sp. 68QC2CO]MCQ9386226.1 Fic family protein [Brevibacterium sp. 68QC2CO]